MKESGDSIPAVSWFLAGVILVTGIFIAFVFYSFELSIIYFILLIGLVITIIALTVRQAYYILLFGWRIILSFFAFIWTIIHIIFVNIGLILILVLIGLAIALKIEKAISSIGNYSDEIEVTVNFGSDILQSGCEVITWLWNPIVRPSNILQSKYAEQRAKLTEATSLALEQIIESIPIPIVEELARVISINLYVGWTGITYFIIECIINGLSVLPIVIDATLEILPEIGNIVVTLIGLIPTIIDFVAKVIIPSLGMIVQLFLEIIFLIFDFVKALVTGQGLRGALESIIDERDSIVSLVSELSGALQGVWNAISVVLPFVVKAITIMAKNFPILGAFIDILFNLWIDVLLPLIRGIFYILTNIISFLIDIVSCLLSQLGLNRTIKIFDYTIRLNFGDSKACNRISLARFAFIILEPKAVSLQTSLDTLTGGDVKLDPSEITPYDPGDPRLALCDSSIGNLDPVCQVSSFATSPLQSTPSWISQQCSSIFESSMLYNNTLAGFAKSIESVQTAQDFGLLSWCMLRQMFSVDSDLLLPTNFNYTETEIREAEEEVQNILSNVTLILDSINQKQIQDITNLFVDVLKDVKQNTDQENSTETIVNELQMGFELAKPHISTVISKSYSVIKMTKKIYASMASKQTSFYSSGKKFGDIWRTFEVTKNVISEFTKMAQDPIKIASFTRLSKAITERAPKFKNHFKTLSALVQKHTAVAMTFTNQKTSRATSPILTTLSSLGNLYLKTHVMESKYIVRAKAEAFGDFSATLVRKSVEFYQATRLKVARLFLRECDDPQTTFDILRPLCIPEIPENYTCPFGHLEISAQIERAFLGSCWQFGPPGLSFESVISSIMYWPRFFLCDWAKSHIGNDVIVDDFYYFFTYEGTCIRSSTGLICTLRRTLLQYAFAIYAFVLIITFGLAVYDFVVNILTMGAEAWWTMERINMRTGARNLSARLSRKKTKELTETAKPEEIIRAINLLMKKNS